MGKSKSFIRPGSRLLVATVKQLLDVGGTVQYLAAQPGEGKQTAVTVLLQAASAHFQLFSQFAVRIEFSPAIAGDLPAKRRSMETERRSTVEKNSLICSLLSRVSRRLSVFIMT